MINDGFNTAPEGYVCREFRKVDGILEGVQINHAIIGGTIEKDGEPVGYAGVNLIIDRHWVFFFIKDESLRRPMWLMRLMRDSFRMFRDGGIIDLYALCDLRMPRAPEFLTALGFTKMREMTKAADILTYEKLMTFDPDLPCKAWHVDLRYCKWL